MAKEERYTVTEIEGGASIQLSLQDSGYSLVEAVAVAKGLEGYVRSKGRGWRLEAPEEAKQAARR